MFYQPSCSRRSASGRPHPRPSLRAILVAIAAALSLPATAAASIQHKVMTDADAYVVASWPSWNYGGASAIRSDNKPTIGYLRFTPQNLSGTVTAATLRVYTTTSSSTGFDVRRAGASSWTERALTYNNRPATSSDVTARSGAFSKGRWLSLDVTSAVTGGEAVTLAITSSMWTTVQLASREAGSTRAPHLMIETAAAPVEPVEPVEPPATAGVRPYDVQSPWNTPIGTNPVVDPSSASLVAAISDNGLPLTSDPDQYAIPVYNVDAQTPRRSVQLSGYFSSYDNGDNSRVGHGWAPTISDVPVPDAAVQSAGSDGQIVFWDPASGTEYSFWQFDKDASGNYIATNGVRYHTTAGYFGRFADGRAGRGAGLPYMAGLVRRWEIDQGRIDHALAFAYSSPSSAFVYPASKSDGVGVLGTDVPEGTRLQLDPSLTDADFDRWGLTAPAKVIARALQRYGMYVVDVSGSSKIYLEDRKTAGWGPDIDRHLTERIPWTAFRAVAPPAAP